MENSAHDYKREGKERKNNSQLVCSSAVKKFSFFQKVEEIIVSQENGRSTPLR